MFKTNCEYGTNNQLNNAGGTGQTWYTSRMRSNIFDFGGQPTAHGELAGVAHSNPSAPSAVGLDFFGICINVETEDPAVPDSRYTLGLRFL